MPTGSVNLDRGSGGGSDRRQSESPTSDEPEENSTSTRTESSRTTTPTQSSGNVGSSQPESDSEPSSQPSEPDTTSAGDLFRGREDSGSTIPGTSDTSESGSDSSGSSTSEPSRSSSTTTPTRSSGNIEPVSERDDSNQPPETDLGEVDQEQIEDIEDRRTRAARGRDNNIPPAQGDSDDTLGQAVRSNLQRASDFVQPRLRSAGQTAGGVVSTFSIAPEIEQRTTGTNAFDTVFRGAGEEAAAQADLPGFVDMGLGAGEFALTGTAEDDDRTRRQAATDATFDGARAFSDAAQERPAETFGRTVGAFAGGFGVGGGLRRGTQEASRVRTSGDFDRFVADDRAQLQVGQRQDRQSSVAPESEIQDALDQMQQTQQRIQRESQDPSAPRAGFEDGGRIGDRGQGPTRRQLRSLEQDIPRVDSPQTDLRDLFAVEDALRSDLPQQTRSPVAETGAGTATTAQFLSSDIGDDSPQTATTLFEQDAEARRQSDSFGTPAVGSDGDFGALSAEQTGRIESEFELPGTAVGPGATTSTDIGTDIGPGFGTDIGTTPRSPTTTRQPSQTRPATRPPATTPRSVTRPPRTPARPTPRGPRPPRPPRTPRRSRRPPRTPSFESDFGEFDTPSPTSTGFTTAQFETGFAQPEDLGFDFGASSSAENLGSQDMEEFFEFDTADQDFGFDLDGFGTGFDGDTPDLFESNTSRSGGFF